MHVRLVYGWRFSDDLESVLLFVMQFSLPHPQVEFPLAATACRSRLNALTLSNLHCRFVVDCRSSHPLLDLSGHRQKSLLDIRGVLSRGF